MLWRLQQTGTNTSLTLNGTWPSNAFFGLLTAVDWLTTLTIGTSAFYPRNWVLNSQWLIPQINLRTLYFTYTGALNFLSGDGYPVDFRKLQSSFPGTIHATAQNISLIQNQSQNGASLAPPGNWTYVTINNGGGGACFTSSSKLLTPTGYKTADKVRTGDLLLTPDGRQIPIKAFQSRVLGTKETAPFLVPKHSLSASSPAQDLHLSPWHAIQVRKGVWQKPATAAETNSRIVQYGLGEEVSYFHFEAPNYFTDNLICDGTVVESFANKQVKGDGKVYHYNRALKGFTRSAILDAKKMA